MADTIKSAIDNYVSLFYSMNTQERAAYIKSMSAVRYRIKKESNMLFMAAILGEAGEEQKAVKDGLFRHLYSMPFNSSSPCPTSPAMATTGQPYFSFNQGRITDVSNPPE